VCAASKCDEEQERRDAVEKILKIRGEGDEMTQLGDSRVRPRKTPTMHQP